MRVAIDAMKERGLRSSVHLGDARVVTVPLRRRRPLVNEDYVGRQVVGIDLHRHRSVQVRMTDDRVG
jgi:hypothetical protein